MSVDATSVAPWIQVIAPLVQITLAFTGWKIILWDNKKRENRKEARVLIDSISRRVESIEELAKIYYSSVDDQSEKRAANLKNEIKKLNASIVVLTRINSGFTSTEHQSTFRNAVTGGDFETASRTTKSANDPYFEKVSEGAIDLLDHLEIQYEKLFLS